MGEAFPERSLEPTRRESEKRKARPPGGQAFPSSLSTGAEDPPGQRGDRAPQFVPRISFTSASI